MRLFFLALLGMVEILWRDWRGGHETSCRMRCLHHDE